MATSRKKYFSISEVKKHCRESDLWIIIDGKVYDVTKFLEEHPGGQEVLMEQAGLDATMSFQDIGHSSSAQELMKDYYIGDLLIDSIDSKKQDKEERDELLSDTKKSLKNNIDHENRKDKEEDKEKEKKEQDVTINHISNNNNDSKHTESNKNQQGGIAGPLIMLALLTIAWAGVIFYLQVQADRNK